MSWICKICETENPDSLKICEVCESPRENDTADIDFFKEKYGALYKSVIRYQYELLKAADKGNTIAQYKLGEWFNNHNSLEAYKKEALVWYEKAAKKDNKDATRKLIKLYIHEKTLIDVASAIKWYKKLGEDISRDDYYAIGEAFEKGHSGQKNIHTAVKYYKKASEKGHFMAQFKLGVAYELGGGTSKKLPEAKKMYEKAATLGCNTEYRIKRIDEKIEREKNDENGITINKIFGYIMLLCSAIFIITAISEHGSENFSINEGKETVVWIMSIIFIICGIFLINLKNK